MNVFLSHIDWSPLIYGLVMYAGIHVMYRKLVNGSFLSLIIDIVVFTLVFKLHGGSMAGGFSAMIAALIAGVTFPRMMR